MGKYVIKRLLLLIPTLLLVCLIVFALMRMVPGSAVDIVTQRMQSTGADVDTEAVEQMLGLDKPFFTQFFGWLGDILHGDLGDSFFQSGSVSSIIGLRLPITIELGILTLILTNLISIPLGLYCAARQDSISDNTIRAISVLMMSIPVFWIATIILVYPAVWWSYAPPTEYVSFLTNPIENMKLFIIPALLGAVTTAGAQLRNVRTLTLEVLRQDYIRTCWAKGLKERSILMGHALRNTMVPVITMIGGSVGGLIGGSVILETMFNIPGIGNQMVTALANRDYPLVEGCTLIMAVIVMLVNLLVDIAYKWIDPRVEIE